MFTSPSVTNFKAYFVRDFPYGIDPSAVMDQDITNALADAGFNFNQALFSTQAQFTLGYLLLAAHYLVTNLRASSQGIAGTYSWLETSKGVANVSSGFQIPERIMAYPQYAMLTKTHYGAKFLQLLLPRLTGQIFTTPGRTQP
jgi:hypothetical protein